jgi:membrane associated rhomboid family serine protease
MENNGEIKLQSKTIKDMMKTWRFWKPFVGAAIGGGAGFLYYYFIGCSSGSCAITSSPVMSTVWGGLLGLFLVKSPCSSGKC